MSIEERLKVLRISLYKTLQEVPEEIGVSLIESHEWAIEQFRQENNNYGDSSNMSKCKHPKEKLVNYHDKSVLCKGCNSVIEQYGKKIEPPTYQGVLT